MRLRYGRYVLDPIEGIMSESNGQAVAYINDGYTERGYIAGVPGLHGPLRFAYRPALLEEVTAYNRGADKLKDHELNKYAARWAAGRLQSWDLTDHKGNPIPIAADALLRLRSPRLFYRLVRIFLGDEASDIDPAWSAEEAEQERRDRVAAEAAGQPLAEFRQERDRKN